jgi:outer membrane protein
MKYCVALLALMITWNMTAYPQTGDEMTLTRAVQVALERNVTVIQARNNLSASESGTRSAVGGLLPSLDASGRFNRSQAWNRTVQLEDGSYIDNPAGTQFGARNSWSAGVSANWVLFDGFSNFSSITRADANLAASQFTVARTEQTVIYQTHQLYLNVARTFHLLKVNEDNLKRSQRQLERITESNKVGAVALADVYRQQVQSATDELALIQAQNSFEQAKADLVAFLGVEVGPSYSFAFNEIPLDIDTSEFRSLNAQYTDFNGLVTSALANRPDYLASIEEVRSAEESETIARSGHLPTLSANGSYGYGHEEFGNLWKDRSFDLGLTLSVPIFRGFSVQTQVEQAQVLRKNSEEQNQQARRQIAVDIRKSLFDLETAEKQLAVTQKAVASADMDRKIAEEKYTLGASTLLDLLVATANYTTALSNKVNAVMGYLLAKKAVEYSLGTISR